MRRGRAFALFIVPGILAAGLALGLPRLRRALEERLRRTVAARASTALGGEVTVGRLDLAFFPPTARLSDVGLAKRGNRGSEATGRLDRVTVRAGPLTFLGLARGPVTIAFDRPDLRASLAPGRDLVPKTGGGGSAAALLADIPPGSRLTVSGGALDVQEIEGPGLRLGGVRAEARPAVPPGTAAGSLSFESGELRGVPGRWTGLAGEIVFALRDGTLRLDSVAAHGAGLALSGRGRIGPAAGVAAGGVPEVGVPEAVLPGSGPAGGAEFAGEVRLGLDLDTLRDLLPAGAEPAGRVELQMNGGWGGAGPQARGDLSAMAIRLFGLDLDSLRADLEIGKRWTVTGIKAHLLGGEATGSLGADPAGGSWRTEVDLRVDGVELERLLRVAGWSGPELRGTVHYRGRHTIDRSGIASLSGSGVLDAVGHYVSPHGADLPLEVTSNLETAGSTIRLSGGTLRAGSVRGSFSGTAAPGQGIRLRLSGATGDISEILPLFSTASKRPPPSSSPRAAPAPARPAGTPRPVRLVSWTPDPAPQRGPLETIVAALGGQWRWDGDLRYDRDGLRFDGRLTGTGLTLHGAALGDLEASVASHGRDLSLTEATLRPPDGGTVAFAGTVGFGDPGSVALEATLSECPIAPLVALAGRSWPIAGRVSGRVSVTGSPDAPSGRAIVESGVMSIAGVPFDEAHGELRLAAGLLEARALTLRQGDGRLVVDGRIPIHAAGTEGAGPAPRLELRGEGLDLTRLAPGVPLAGAFRLQGALGGGLDAPSGEADAAFESATLAGEPLGPGTVTAAIEGGTLTLRAGLPQRHLEARGTIRMEEDWPADLSASFEGTEIHPIAGPGSSGPGAAAVLTGEATLRGPLLDRRRLAGRATLRGLECSVAGVTVRARGPVGAALESGRLRLDPVVLAGEGTEVEVGGAADLAPAGAVEGRARGRFDLRLLRPFFRNLQAAGTGTVEMTLSGNRDRPVFQGTLGVTAGALRYPDLPFPIGDLEARASFEDSRMRIASIRLKAGGGPMEGEGEAVLALLPGGGRPFAVSRAEVRLRGRDVKSEFPEGFHSAADLDVVLRYDAAGAVLSGTVDLVRGVYSRDFRLESTLVQGGRDLFAPAPPRGPVADLRLDLAIHAPGDLWLRNDFGSIEGEADLRVRGTAAHPIVAGRVTAHEGGTIRFRNVRYRVTRATADFADPEAIHPIFDVEAETSVAEYQVTLHIEGAVDAFHYELTSTPPLAQQDIVALLLTGHTLGPVAAGGRTFGEETVSAYLGGRLSEELSGRTGLDLIAIDPLQVNAQGDPAARVTIGKRVTPDLFLTYSSDLSSTQGPIYQVDYSLGRDLKLTTLRDRDGSLGGDLRYVLRGRPPILPGQPETAVLSTRPVLGAVHLTGEPRFKEGVIRRRLRLRPGGPRDRAAVNDGIERLLAFYRDHDFLMAEAQVEERPSGPGRVDLFVRLEAGPRVRVAFSGARDREGLRQKVVPFWQKGIFLDDIVEAARARLQTLFRDRGYLRAQVRAVVEENTPETFRVRFAIERGARARAREVRLEGVAALPARLVRKAIDTRAGGWLSRGIVRDATLRHDVDAIRDLYLSRGYAHVAVEDPEVLDDPKSRRSTVVFRVREGPRVVVREVVFEGVSVFRPEHLREAIGIRPGSTYTAAAADAALVAVRRVYDDAGFPDVRVQHRLKETGGDAPAEPADLVVGVDEGRHQVVGAVEVEGNALTREEVIRRALTVRPGSPLSRSDLLESQRRLYQRGIFTSVSVDPGPSGADTPVRPVAVKVREAPPITQVFGVGYDSEEKARAQYEIADRNIFGSGRYVGLQGRASDLVQNASLLFQEMGIFGGQYDAQASTYWQKEALPGFDARTLGSSVQISRRFTRATRVLYRYSLRDVDQSAAASVPQGTTLRLSSLSDSVVHDTRDAPFDPLRGHYLSGEASYFGRSIGSEAEFGKFYAQAFFFKEVLPRTVWAQAVRAGAALTFGVSARDPARTGDLASGLPPTERFFAGGDTTLRGFRRDRVGPLDATGDPFGGEGLFVLNEEIRFPIVRLLQGVVFYDAGNVYRTLRDYDPTDVRQDAGLGLRVATPIGPIRLEYGAVLDRQAGEPAGEFFISIGQAF